QRNIFRSGVDPNTLVIDSNSGTGGTGLIDVSSPLDDNHAFVQTLYNNLLGRTGQVSELNLWVNLLVSPGGGRNAVVNGIKNSPEALGRIVENLYLKFLGRQADVPGRAGFINALEHGVRLDDIEAIFVTSPEYLSHINTDYFQSLYL